MIERICLPLRWQNTQLSVLDQTQLPQRSVWLEIHSPDDMVRAIQRLSVRGAPLIGVAATVAVAQQALKVMADEYFKTNSPIPATPSQRQDFLLLISQLRNSRPTAVNLMNLLDAQKAAFEASAGDLRVLVTTALSFFDEDVAMAERMSLQTAEFINDGDQILTHCNTGGLATVGIGTALGGIKQAWRQGKRIHVYVDETRPLLQGARLTTWELQQEGIPFTLITDNMAGAAMAQGKINKAFVGADRIAANGDVANKIGTYSVAVLARYHQIPFYVVAPQSTLDPQTKTGRDIVVEERSAHEVILPGQVFSDPEAQKVWNPSFDVTPRELITAIITDRGPQAFAATTV